MFTFPAQKEAKYTHGHGLQQAFGPAGAKIIKEAAAREENSPEEVVRDAVEARLSRAEWAKTLEFGSQNARDRGITLEDVDRELAADRSERGR